MTGINSMRTQKRFDSGFLKKCICHRFPQNKFLTRQINSYCIKRVRELASGVRQLAGTKTKYRRAHAAPLAGLISDRAKCLPLEYRVLIIQQGAVPCQNVPSVKRMYPFFIGIFLAEVARPARGLTRTRSKKSFLRNAGNAMVETLSLRLHQRWHIPGRRMV